LIAWCTYCSADKRTDPEPLPALERYLDDRIHALAAAAEAAGVAFLILSGEYGLLRPEAPIPWYDHLLQQEAVDSLAAKVSEQLTALGCTELTYYTVSEAADPKIVPYRNTITQACAIADTELMIIMVP